MPSGDFCKVHNTLHVHFSSNCLSNIETVQNWKADNKVPLMLKIDLDGFYNLANLDVVDKIFQLTTLSHDLCSNYLVISFSESKIP
eukprot:scaffold6047_cov200-Pinguiococcus_pyrenoidosus.AAC.1